MSDYPNSLADARELIDQLNVALDSRDLIGQAKGILMARENITEDDAFDILVRASQRQNQKLRGAAAQVVQANNDRHLRTDRGSRSGPSESTPLQDATALLTVAMEGTATEELRDLVAELGEKDQSDELMLAVVALCRSLCLATSKLVRVLDDGLTESEADRLTHDDLLPTAMQVVRSFANAAARNAHELEPAQGVVAPCGLTDLFEPGSTADPASP